MAETFDFDVLIIGAGPGGYVAAVRASQLGLSSAVIEHDKPGGVCLNVGCIPSKNIIHQAEIFGSITQLEKMGLKVDISQFDYSTVFNQSRRTAQMLSKGVQYLLKKNKVRLITGHAVLSGPHEVTVDNTDKFTGRHIIIATGSSPRQLKGFEFDEQTILSSTGVLMLRKLPRRMLILGAGAIGVEFAYIMNCFGVEVHLVEMMESILPLEDAEAVNVVVRSFRKQGITISTSTKALAHSSCNGSVNVTLENKQGERTVVQTDTVLVAVGRTPNTGNIGLDVVGIEPDSRGYIPVGDYCRTNISDIYAIGDIIESPQLAHVASKEGEIAVEHIAGRKPLSRIDPSTIPGAVYCEPQVASFGLTEQQAKQSNIAYEKTVFPYRATGKAVAIGKPEGLVKILFDPDSRMLSGAHIVGTQATELIHELLVARTAGLEPQQIGAMIHAHPTLSESVMEVMRGVDGVAIHI